MQVRHANWTIILDIYKRKKRPTCTRIRAPYVNRDSFQFNLYRKRLSSGMRKTLGMPDVEIGFPNFDREFIIQGNDETKLRSLFQPDRIRGIILWQPDIQLSSNTDASWQIDPTHQ